MPPTSRAERRRRLPRLALEEIQPSSGVAGREPAIVGREHAREGAHAKLVDDGGRQASGERAVREHERVAHDEQSGQRREHRAQPRGRARSVANGASRSALSPPTEDRRHVPDPRGSGGVG